MDEPHAVQKEPGAGDLGTEKCPHPLPPIATWVASDMLKIGLRNFKTIGV